MAEVAGRGCVQYRGGQRLLYRKLRLPRISRAKKRSRLLHHYFNHIFRLRLQAIALIDASLRLGRDRLIRRHRSHREKAWRVSAETVETDHAQPIVRAVKTSLLLPADKPMSESKQAGQGFRMIKVQKVVLSRRCPKCFTTLWQGCIYCEIRCQSKCFAKPLFYSIQWRRRKSRASKHDA